MKDDIFCDFMFASLGGKALQKLGLHKKKEPALSSLPVRVELIGQAIGMKIAELVLIVFTTI